MPCSRTTPLKSSFALLVGLAILARAPSVRAESATLGQEGAAAHALDRLGYGPRPGDLQAVTAEGVDRWIDVQLNPERIPVPADLQQRLDSFETLRLSPVELFKQYGPPRAERGVKPTPEEMKASRQRARVIMAEAVQARFLRAVDSPRQLQEVMVDFWFNHFNVSAAKGLDYLWTGSFEETAIRPHVFGRFRDLLEATAKHPAMLFYLDNWQNTEPGSPGAKRREDGLNENYARELMELHTLGVDGGYTQQDVIALAHILTGWGLPPGRGGGRPGLPPPSPDGFYFDAERHDFSDKVFLGHTIRGSGQAEVEQVLDILARSPTTAHHLSYQLAQYFVADEPDPVLVDVLAKRYLATDGNIREVLRTLFHSEQFWDRKTFEAKYKTPYQYVVSAVRAAGVPMLNARPLYGTAAQMGMPVYAYLTPEGYKNTRDAWLSPDATAKRLTFATALAAGRLPVDRPPPPEAAPGEAPMPKPPGGALVGLAMPASDGVAAEPAIKPVPLDAQAILAGLGHRFGPRTLDAINTADPKLQAAMVLGSPEFMQR
ncbi:MAG TPA: DUF1800 domain-containing protein [Stellaceae bacterium]|nr:DUF1800 domain-containing protein [Stellaceae bacterium]